MKLFETTERYTTGMTIQIAIKLPDQLVAEMDRLVRQGTFTSRTQAVRAGVEAVIHEQHRHEISERFRSGFARWPETEAELADAQRLAIDAIHEEPWERWW